MSIHEMHIDSPKVVWTDEQYKSVQRAVQQHIHVVIHGHAETVECFSRRHWHYVEGRCTPTIGYPEGV